MAYEAKFWTFLPSSCFRIPSIGKFFFFLNKSQFNLRHSNPIQRVNFSIWVHEIKLISLLVSVPVKSSRRHRSFPRRVRGDLRRPLDERHAQKHHQVEARHKVGPEHSSCVIFCLECVKFPYLALTQRLSMDSKAKTRFFLPGDARSCNFIMTGSIISLPPYN